VTQEHSSGDGCLSFDAIGFQSVGCGKFPIPMWVKAESPRMQFARFPDRCTTGGTTHGLYLLYGEFLSFHSVVVFLLRRWLNRQEENISFCSGHLPAENFLESALNFFGVKQFLTGLMHAQEDRAKATGKTAQY
jgi:hypothetical protein